MGAIAEGRDPASERDARTAMATVSQIIELFMEKHVRPKRKRTTAALYQHVLTRHVDPFIGHIRIAEVTPADLTKIHLSLHDRPYLANRMLAAVASMLAWARAHKFAPDECAPAKKIEKFPERSRERFLTLKELERLGSALREAETAGIPWCPDPSKKVKHAPHEASRRVKISPYAAAAIRLLLLTGARLREVLHLQWQQVDFERGLLFLPDSKTGKKILFLNGPAIEVLQSLKRLGPFVIPGHDVMKPRRDLKRPWSLVIRRADLADVRLHDLRHSFAAYGAGGGLSLPIIGKLLGHTQARTTARYAHLANDPVRRASEQIGQGIANALRGSS